MVDGAMTDAGELTGVAVVPAPPEVGADAEGALEAGVPGAGVLGAAASEAALEAGVLVDGVPPAVPCANPCRAQRLATSKAGNSVACDARNFARNLMSS